MELKLHSSHGTLLLKPSLPQGWNGPVLPGSDPHFYEGDVGRVLIQKFHDEDFSICYSTLEFFKKVEVFWTEAPLLRLQYLLSGTLKYKAEGEATIKLRQGQMNAVWSPERKTTANFIKGRYELFQIACRPELVQRLAPQFPTVNSFPSESSRMWMGAERTKDIYALFHSTYSGDVRRFFYETKVREQLLSFLLSSPSAANGPYSEEEMERIYRVDSKILEDLSKHHTTSELAHFAKMTEARLIFLYKEIIGTTMFERYREAKLEKARKYLLESDIQIKVLYEMVGYESYTGFVEAFSKRFGLSPLQYRKKYKPFD